MNFPKSYNPQETEPEVYARWLKEKAFAPQIKKGKKPFVIVIPPPNITGSLHMGHALNNTIQDVLIRIARMKNIPTLWLPGTDHAGIATQNVVEKELLKEGKNRHDLGREKFIKKVWEWKKQYGGIILDQLKKLGCSCDWSRARFTMDENYAEAVKEAFVKYYEDGLIYRGWRIVNWCPRCGTSLSDIELEYKEELGHLWYIKYPLKQIANGKSQMANITVATTRPETMLGDTAVAVNPSDPRYKKLIGRKAILPILNREIPIIADKAIDSSFGTGAVKVTPAHDATDYEIGQRHNLPIIQVIGEDGKMTAEAGENYEGLTVEEARDHIVDDLTELGLIEKIEEYSHEVSHCYRCGTVIEPLMSKQWFVAMKSLALPALAEIKKGLKFSPERFEKVYADWLKNIKDWCISRQIWWGHQLPVFFCKKKTAIGIKNSKVKIKNEAEEFIVAKEKPKKCPFCKTCQMVQSEDVLDTWFSSALWPFATMGWPKETKDFKHFYPTTTLVTARDIMHLWVSRMVMAGLYFTKKRPFDNVVINATILTKDGKRMSKSLGTGIDPLELIQKYGADATRFGLIAQAAKGQDVRFQEEQIRAARNFANKIWNIARFLTLRPNLPKSPNSLNTPTLPTPLTPYQKWILAKLAKTTSAINRALKEYDFSEYAKTIYHFSWDQFASIYLEESKKETAKNTSEILTFVYQQILKLLHPLMPHLTEKIYGLMFQNALITADWPEKINYAFPKEEKEVDKKLDQLQKERSKAVPQKEIDALKNYIAALETRLADKKFLAKAPREIVEMQKQKLAEANKKLSQIVNA